MLFCYSGQKGLRQLEYVRVSLWVQGLLYLENNILSVQKAEHFSHINLHPSSTTISISLLFLLLRLMRMNYQFEVRGLKSSIKNTVSRIHIIKCISVKCISINNFLFQVNIQNMLQFYMMYITEDSLLQNSGNLCPRRVVLPDLQCRHYSHPSSFVLLLTSCTPDGLEGMVFTSCCSPSFWLFSPLSFLQSGLKESQESQPKPRRSLSGTLVWKLNLPFGIPLNTFKVLCSIQ